MTALISFLVFLLIFGIVLYAVYLVLNYLPLPAPIRQIALLIVGVIGLLILLQHFLGMTGHGGFAF